MVKIAITYTVGCLWVLQQQTLYTVPVTALIIAIFVLLFFRLGRLIAILIIAVAITHWHGQQHIDSQLSTQYINTPISITGYVIGIPERRDHYIRFLLAPDDPRLPPKVLLSWYYPPEDLLINSGEYWQMTVKLKPATGLSNPGGFNYEQWLVQQGIGATGYVRQQPIPFKQRHAQTFQIDNFRQLLAQKIDDKLTSSPYIGLAQALTTGIQQQIPQTQWQQLSQTGTQHLLAISGLHIGLAAWLGYLLLGFIGSRFSSLLIYFPKPYISVIGGTLCAIAYAALAGFSLPTQRALLMVVIFMLSMLSSKPIAPPQRLAFAALVIAIMDPFALLSASFYLSFIAVAIILTVMSTHLPKQRWQWLFIHFAIALGLSPILLLFFQETPLISPLANLVAVPFISLIVVPLLALACLSLLFSTLVSDGLFQIVDLCFHLFITTLSFFTSLPIPTLSVNLTLTLLICLSLGCYLLLLPRTLPHKWLSLICFLPLLMRPTHQEIADGEMTLTLLDVGQGLSAIIDTAHHRLIFDTGAQFSPRFNIGEAVILPFLRASNRPHIDTIVISHSDNDHIGGLTPLLKETTPDLILTSDTSAITNSQPCYAGHSWRWDNVNFSFLHPTANDSGNKNHRSCVLRITTASHSLLLTGDIDKRAEQQIIRRYPKQLASTVLVAPHHGSSSSSSQAFIEAVSPDYVLFAAGYQNRYGFPHNAVVQRYQRQGTTMYSTGIEGAITVLFSQQKALQIYRHRQQSAKFWSVTLSE